MWPGDQLLEALPKLNAAFPFTFLSSPFGVTGLSRCSEQLRRKVEAQDPRAEPLPVVGEDGQLNTAPASQLRKPFAQSSAFYVLPLFIVQSKVLVLFTHFSR